MADMRKLILVAAVGALAFACGARDNKNKAENYPTYDTSQATNRINDSASGVRGGQMQINQDDGGFR